MLKGVLKKEKRTSIALKSGILVASISLMFHGLLIQSGIMPISETAIGLPPDLAIVLSMSWLVIGVTAFLSRIIDGGISSVLILLVYYVLSLAQSLFITGFISPFTAYWILLMIITFAMLGKNGLLAGIMAFIIAITVSAVLNVESHPEYAIMAILSGTSVIVCSLVASSIYFTQKIVNSKLNESRERENVEKGKVLTLINNITDAIISTDEHGIITMYNSAALNLIDTNNKISGKPIDEILRLETTNKTPLDTFKELSKSIAIRQRDDIIMQVDSDEALRLEVTFAPVQGGDKMSPDGYVLILRDITKAKSLEEERDEFISVVSHELRTPITIAEGSLSNAKLLIEKGVADKVPQAIDESHKQILFLARMANDLSTLSRAERGVDDKPEIINVAEFAAQLNDEYAPQAAEKGLAFNLDIDSSLGEVKASSLYLQELLQNFITNAIRYTPKGSVTISIKKQKDGQIKFKVKDTGIGIGKADLGKIFDKFYRAEDYRTRETSGSGLGLYVAAKLARKLNCKIEVQSRLNHGSAFSFSLKPFKK